MDAWSLFWRQGHFTTFGKYFEKGYAGTIKEWLESLPPQLETFTDRLQVLELCCGNGSLVPFLLSLNNEFDYIGIDAAKVALPISIRETIRGSASTAKLLSETCAEDLPDDLEAISLCLSIYGIEYSPLEATLAGLLNRMEPDGKLFALLHHKESVVAKMSSRAVNEYHAPDIENIHNALTTIHERLSQTGGIKDLKEDLQAEQARKLMNGMGNKYIKGADMETGNAFMADHVLSALRFFKVLRKKASIRAKFISELTEEAYGARERHRQMLSVAKDAAQMRSLAEDLATMGWSKVETNLLEDKEGIIGWTLAATA